MKDFNQGQIRIFEIHLTNLKTIEIKALIDTGATLSFISEHLVKRIRTIQPRITIETSRPFNVNTANGEITFPGDYVHLLMRQPHPDYYWQKIRCYVDKGKHLPSVDIVLGITDLRLLGIILTTMLDGRLIF